MIAYRRVLAARVARILPGALSDKRGVSLVEFALVLPVLITLYLGSFQLEDAISCNRKITIATRAVADLVSQNQTGSTSAAEVDGDLYAATMVLAPYSSTAAVIRVTEVATDLTGKTTVQWSRGLNGTGYTIGSTVTTIPTAMKIPGSYFLFAEVTYSYVPGVNFGFVNAMKLYDSIYMLPRNTTSITCSDCTNQ